ncbi:protein nft-1 [Stylonychia lemnae]|uniref:Protein nft-1 n=1 Tax=Stylonychia lemnae TaxID=5949 RepID=A0A078B5E2_STYLE|nr:protein nft-1 [Stylonychia lemnae]|eukprot:CDW88753.1 protein nft-1 [Stylonychia lemnae]
MLNSKILMIALHFIMKSNRLKLNEYREAKKLYLIKQQEFIKCFERFKHRDHTTINELGSEHIYKRDQQPKLMNSLTAIHTRLNSTSKLDTLAPIRHNQTTTTIEENSFDLPHNMSQIRAQSRNRQSRQPSLKYENDLVIQGQQQPSQVNLTMSKSFQEMEQQTNEEAQKIQLMNNIKVYETFSTVSARTNGLNLNTIAKIEIEDINYLNKLKSHRSKERYIKEGKSNLLQKKQMIQNIKAKNQNQLPIDGKSRNRFERGNGTNDNTSSNLRKSQKTCLTINFDLINDKQPSLVTNTKGGQTGQVETPRSNLDYIPEILVPDPFMQFLQTKNYHTAQQQSQNISSLSNANFNDTSIIQEKSFNRIKSPVEMKNLSMLSGSCSRLKISGKQSPTYQTKDLKHARQFSNKSQKQGGKQMSSPFAVRQKSQEKSVGRFKNFTLLKSNSKKPQVSTAVSNFNDKKPMLGKQSFSERKPPIKSKIQTVQSSLNNCMAPFQPVKKQGFIYKTIKDMKKFDKVYEPLKMQTQRHLNLKDLIKDEILRRKKHIEYEFGPRIKIHSDQVFYENDHVFAFVNIRPVLPGHVLDGLHAGQTVPHVHLHVLPAKDHAIGEAEVYGNARSIDEMKEEAMIFRKLLEEFQIKL